VVKHTMSSLQKEELGEYIKTSLVLAGIHEDLFSQPSIEVIYGVTSGVPRLVNSQQTLFDCLWEKETAS